MGLEFGILEYALKMENTSATLTTKLRVPLMRRDSESLLEGQSVQVNIEQYFNLDKSPIQMTLEGLFASIRYTA